MNLQPASQPRTSTTGYGRRRHEREGSGGGGGGGTRGDPHRSQSSKSSSNKSAPAGGGKVGGPCGDRLVYTATCLIGQTVEVQVKDGSVYNGIFHASNADKDFGIILKMAHLTKDGSVKGWKADGESLRKPPLKTLVIPDKDLVQVIAKDVAVTSDGLKELQHEKKQELLIDSCISQSRHVDAGRVLEPWVPDEDDPQCPELENIFDGHSNRKWDQFETNETLFGVKSTFDEELYTTKLERGPRMKELEKEASRIAREIEGEVTQDLHLAEERGFNLHEDSGIDEETRYSSVYRGRVVDDSGLEEDEDILFNTRNTETFGDSVAPITSGFVGGLTSRKSTEEVSQSSSSFNVENRKTSGSAPEADFHTSSTSDNTRQTSSDIPRGNFASGVSRSRLQESSSTDLAEDNDSKVQAVRQQLDADARASQSEDADPQSSVNEKKDVFDKGASLPDAFSHLPPSEVSLKDQQERRPTNERVEGTVSGKSTHTESPSADCSQRPGSSRSSTGSLSSEKSTLNPHAKEFKLNPNAKSFVPIQTPIRPQSPISDSSFYVPSNMAPVAHMHGMPVGVGMAPPFVGHQPVMFHPQFGPMHPPQGYHHPNAPQYGQQVLYGHPRQVPYMPSYPPEMPYKRRDY